MVFDKTGALASVSRHDYLPFGEELFAGTGGRTTALGYTNNDGARQKFTGYEADAETGLNFAQARYQSSVQGRFTSADPLLASASVSNPQSFNRYSYVVNNPVNLTDPTGMVNSHGDSLYPWEEDHWGDIPWTDGGSQQESKGATTAGMEGNYFIGRGTVDPVGPKEYRVDGFDMGMDDSNDNPKWEPPVPVVFGIWSIIIVAIVCLVILHKNNYDKAMTHALDVVLKPTFP